MFWKNLFDRVWPFASPDAPADTLPAGPVWQVDLHNHLLPGVDDGVKTTEDSLTCLTKFAEWGIRHVICTPHVSQDYYPNRPDELRQAAVLLARAVAEAELPLTVTVAAEYMMDELFDKHLNEGTLLSFGAARYVLIETGWAAAPFQLEQWLFSMQLKGYTPVLAHPERYSYYRDEWAKLTSLREHGCLFQLNLMSLAGRYGSSAQQMAEKLIDRKMVEFIASDLHRPADLSTLGRAIDSSAFAKLSKLPLLNGTL
jgi:protein-tyrosine phosphatase